MPLLYSMTAPVVVIVPIRLPPHSVNHRLPSGPVVMLKIPAGELMPLVYSVTKPAVVIFPILLGLPPSENQRLPSGPAVIAYVKELMPLVNSVIPPPPLRAHV